MSSPQWEPIELEIFPRLHGAASCSWCGAIVPDNKRELHDKWHDGLSRTASRAATFGAKIR